MENGKWKMGTWTPFFFVLEHFPFSNLEFLFLEFSTADKTPLLARLAHSSNDKQQVEQIFDSNHTVVTL